MVADGDQTHEESNDAMRGRWRPAKISLMPRRARRLGGTGTTIFAEMSALAQATGALNLGQGFPDEHGPPAVIAAAVRALQDGHNQYAPLPGVPALREAVLAHQRERYGLAPEDVLVTFGATEAIAAALLGLVDPGDEVVVLDPAYDSYAACIGFAGGVRRAVTLRPPDFALDVDALRAAVSPRTRVLLLNTPHNPTGRVLTRAELEALAAVCVEHDLVCVSDEVYEHLVFDGEHLPIATLPGMAERTLTVSSVGKTFSVTGWKIGWISGPAELVRATRDVKQFLTFAGGTPLQHAAAAALALLPEHGRVLSAELRGKRDRLSEGLRAAGFAPLRSQGTYFVNVDVGQDGAAFCRDLVVRAGVVAIPTSVFYAHPDAGASLVRFAFCKRDIVIDEAARRLAGLDGAQG
jgi:N-succinyldiaminopimelate aminotransferase